MDQNSFNDNVKAIAALIVTILSAVAGFVGLPAFATPELVATVATAISAVAGVFYYIRARRTA